MKKILIIAALLFCSHSSFANDDDCPSAAEAAEAQNPNAYKDCDYSKTGLNGVLHKAFSKEKTQDVESNERSNKDKPNKDATEKSSQSTDKIKLTVVAEVSSSQQLQASKFALLEKLILECPKGFVVEGERYLPTDTKALKLDLIYHCL